MSNNTALKTLFAVLHGILPCEYDEKYVTGVGLEDAVVISKTDSDRNIYITANMPDANHIFDMNLYDDIHDDEPAEITQWDIDDPNLTLIDFIDYIEKTL